MLNNKYLCVMAGYDEATAAYLSTIQKRLYSCGFGGRETRGLPQHITLGTYSVELEDIISEKVRSVAENTKSFDITFNHTGIFQGGQVLFIAPDTNAELLKLKEHFGDSFGWTAHSTMLIDDTERLIDALPIVLNNFSSYAGKVTTLYLYEFFPTRHILTVNLNP